jgi:hypothetical protein
MSFNKTYQSELKKEASRLRKTLDEFEKNWGKSSELMLKSIKSEPDYKRKLTVAESIWLAEYARYTVIMDMIKRG